MRSSSAIDDLGQLDVLMLDRFQGALQRVVDQLQAAQGTRLELLQLLLVVDPGLLDHRAHPTLPET